MPAPENFGVQIATYLRHPWRDEDLEVGGQNLGDFLWEYAILPCHCLAACCSRRRSSLWICSLPSCGYTAGNKTILELGEGNREP